jgi:uncharacterized BrkB/YihY/UPF0761 family membrane protein
MLHKNNTKIVKKNTIIKQNTSSVTFSIGLTALILLQLLIIIIGFLALFKCSSVKKWPLWLTVLLILLFFVPGINFFVIIFLIVYFFVTPCY